MGTVCSDSVAVMKTTTKLCNNIHSCQGATIESRTKSLMPGFTITNSSTTPSTGTNKPPFLITTTSEFADRLISTLSWEPPSRLLTQLSPEPLFLTTTPLPTVLLLVKSIWLPLRNTLLLLVTSCCLKLTPKTPSVCT